MVAAAVASLKESARKDRLADFRGRPDKIPDRELPEVRAIRGAPARLRRECIVRAARPGFRDRRLLPLISGNLAGLTAADIESFLPPPDASPDLHEYCRPVYTLCRQIEHSFTTLLDDAERARLRPGLERVAGVFSPPGSPVAIRLRKLIAADGRVPYPYIEDSDAGPRLRAVFADSPEPAAARAALLNLLAVFPDSGDPGQEWRAEARRVRGMLASPDIFAGQLLGAVLDAGIAAYSRPPWPKHGNEAIMCGAALFAGVTAAPTLLPRLRRLALEAASVPAGPERYIPRSTRLAIFAIRALGEAAGPPAGVGATGPCGAAVRAVVA